MNAEHIKIWNWDNAPEKYKSLSCNGGDEDWVAFIPESYQNESLMWMDTGTSFGCSDVHEYRVAGGTVRIGCHA